MDMLTDDDEPPGRSGFGCIVTLRHRPIGPDQTNRTGLLLVHASVLDSVRLAAGAETWTDLRQGRIFPRT